MCNDHARSGMFFDISLFRYSIRSNKNHVSKERTNKMAHYDITHTSDTTCDIITFVAPEWRVSG